MKLILLYILLCVIYSQDNTDKYVTQFSYSYLSTIFLEKYTKNIVVFKGKTNITKCYATGNIKINDTIFEYENSEIISNIDISFPNQEKIESIIKENVKDILNNPNITEIIDDRFCNYISSEEFLKDNNKNVGALDNYDNYSLDIYSNLQMSLLKKLKKNILKAMIEKN